MRRWQKEADQRGNDNGDKSCRLLFETHYWISYWHGMS